MSPLTRHLAALGLRPVGTVTRADVDRAFRAAVLRTHPDRPGGCADEFERVRIARDALLARTVSVSTRSASTGWAQSGADEVQYKYDLSQLSSVRAMDSGGNDARDMRSIMGVVVLPSILAMVVGFRLMALDAGSPQQDAGVVRAGGNSRVDVTTLPSHKRGVDLPPRRTERREQ